MMYKAKLQEKSGAAMVVSICVMALTLVLCLSLLLNVSTGMQAAQKQEARQQASVLAQTLSRQIDEEMTKEGSVLAQALSQKILSGKWPDYQPGRLGHDKASAQRICPADLPQSMAEIVDDCTVTMYWAQDSDGVVVDRTLLMTISCTYQGQKAAVTQSYASQAPVGQTALTWANTGAGSNVAGG